jgi:MFS family permease
VNPVTETQNSIHNIAEGGAPRKSPGWLISRGLVPEHPAQRLLAAASFVNMLGSGVFMISAALFFTRSVGLSVAHVGIGMGAAALVGLLAGMPVGHLADRHGPRGIYLATLTLQGLVMAALVLVHSFATFVVVICVSELAGSASRAARGPIVRRLSGPNPTRFRAYLRSVANLAGSIGALLAAVVVQLDTDAAYTALVLGNALSFLATAALISRLPPMAPVAAPPAVGRWMALRDRPYLVVTALDGIMSIHGSVLLFALPLWIVTQTDAPRWFVGASALLNTAMVVTLQVRASRGVDSEAAAAAAWRRAGVVLLVGMALLATTSGRSGPVAALAITAGVVMVTVGELWHAAGSFELRFRLAPEHAQGQYSGVFGFGSGLAQVVAPFLLGLLCLEWGPPGWITVGALFLLVGLAMPAVVRWAQRSNLALPQSA